MARYLILIVALATGCVGWSKKDTAMELGFAGVAVGDWAQTRGIVGICQEENSMIGNCGQNVPVDVFFPVAILAHAAIAAALPPSWRTVWQAVGAGAEINQVWRNHANGYGMDGSVPPPPAGTMYPRP